MDKGELVANSVRTAASVRSKTVARPAARTNGRHSPVPRTSPPRGKPEAKILFQKYFKSIGSRTYAVQIKEVPNGNHLLVMTEGKRDPETGELRKSRVFVYGEDFIPFFRLLHETAGFIRSHPIPQEVRERRERFWAKKARESRESAAAPAR